MEVWQIILYGVASLLALRALLSQMMHHKRVFQQKLLAEEEQKRRTERIKAQQLAKAQKAVKPAPPKHTNGSAA